jgi:DNA-binding response OmpR family regulator
MELQTLISLAKTLLGLAHHLPAKKHLPVLIVEDNLEDAELIAIYCRDAGADTVIVHTLAVAEELLRTQKFRLLLLDLRFPAGCGVDFARRIRPRHPKLPVVFVTGHTLELTALPPGRKWSFIAKGTNGGSLLEAVRDALLEANGVNGDVKPSELFVVCWLLCGLSALIGGAAAYLIATTKF